MPLIRTQEQDPLTAEKKKKKIERIVSMPFGPSCFVS